MGDKPCLSNADIANEYFKALFKGRHIEYCYMACLSPRGRLTKLVHLSKGTLDSSVVYVRDIAKAAMEAGSKNVILAHNHPAGTLRPSWEDIDLTRRAEEALKILDIRLEEHYIVTSKGCVGIIREGYLNK